ncbi:hypothetical protein CMI37_28755 [Candidatus Pacearchaeota archaeon]|nr:hypothetical protein [Candidatus Pacearchaeota archaeon]|tara:strand:+ start:640 stop:864 length:225 start_codon:yes stop_codon:yes gene_type:complete
MVTKAEGSTYLVGHYQYWDIADELKEAAGGYACGKASLAQATQALEQRQQFLEEKLRELYEEVIHDAHEHFARG